MDSHVGIPDNNGNNNRTTKAIAAAIPMAGIVVAAAFLSGILFLIDIYPTAIAQLASNPPLLNITGIDPNATTGGVDTQSSSACAPTQTGGARGNQSTTSEVRLHIEEACTALQNNDTQSALMHLNLAINALGGGAEGNMTTTTEGNATTTGVTTGGGQ